MDTKRVQIVAITPLGTYLGVVQEVEDAMLDNMYAIALDAKEYMTLTDVDGNHIILKKFILSQSIIKFIVS